MSSSPEELQADVTIDPCEPSAPGTSQDSDDAFSMITDHDEDPGYDGEMVPLSPLPDDYRAMQKRRRALKRLRNRRRKQPETLDTMDKDLRKLTKKIHKMKKLGKMLKKFGRCEVDLEEISKELREMTRKCNKMRSTDKLRRALVRYNVVLVAITAGDDSGPDSPRGVTWPNDNTTG